MRYAVAKVLLTLGMLVLFGQPALAKHSSIDVYTKQPALVPKTKAAQPKQPQSGPGGSKYKCQSSECQSYGEEDSQYWIFRPNNPRPKTAPVIFFFHGWGAMTPETYSSWIDHIVKRGNIVVYPRYQGDFLTTNDEFLGYAIAACKDALKTLQADKVGTRPDLTKVAAVGHSVGGILAANVTARARSAGLPQPLAVMSVEPGRSKREDGMRMITPVVDLSTIPAATLLLSIAGEHDTVVDDWDAKRVFKESTMVPRQNKNYVIVQSDDHGTPPMLADHFAPCAHPFGAKANPRDRFGKGGGDLSGILNAFADRTVSQALNGEKTKALPSEDAVDYYCFWKLFDALTDAAFYNTNRKFALGNTAEQRFMGKWSDGKAARELIIKDQIK